MARSRKTRLYPLNWWYDKQLPSYCLATIRALPANSQLEPSFALALDAFISALGGKEIAYPSLMDGLRAQTIAEAAVESLHTNRPVKITYWQPE